MREKRETISLARYTIQDTLGVGGMGTVYLAHHEILNRPVALKVPRPELARNEVFVQRFLREARALGTLNHPGIVSVYDAGIEDGTPYIAMEYVPGTTLSERILNGGALDLASVIRWGIQMARALAYLHDQKILHRDLKSANVIVNAQDDAVIADFGIAQIEPDSDLTRGVLGTPAYMSPEQAMGKPLDARADLYSLGIILYECVTGEVPFQDDNSYALIQKVIHDPPAPLLERRPDTPAWLAAIIDRCLAKAPGDRFRDGHALLAAFEPGMEHAPAAPIISPYVLPPTPGSTLSAAFSSITRTLSLPRWQSFRTDRSPTVTLYAPPPDARGDTEETGSPIGTSIGVSRRSFKPVFMLLLAAAGVFLIARRLPGDGGEHAPLKRTGVAPANAGDSTWTPIPRPAGARPDITEPADDWTPWPVVDTPDSAGTPIPPQLDEPVAEDSVRSDDDIALVPIVPLKPESRDDPVVHKPDTPVGAGRLDEPAAAPSAATANPESRLPQAIQALAGAKNLDDLTERLDAYRNEGRIRFGNRQSVKEPDLAFIFLTNPTHRTIRSLLVPSQEGWVDFFTGKVVTEENGRFYERGEGIEAGLKWWIHNAEPIWVEIQPVAEIPRKKRRRLGW